MVQVTKKLARTAMLQSYVFNSVENPYDLLENFFDIYTLKKFLKAFKKWYNTLNSNGQIENSAGFLVLHKMTCNLINAAWLVGQINNNASFFIPKMDVQFKQLDLSEVENPYLTLNEIFKSTKLKGFHIHLYDWLQQSLGAESKLISTALDKKIYKLICKIVECCWLITRSDNKKSAVFNVSAQVLTDDIQEQTNCNLNRAYQRLVGATNSTSLNNSLRKLLTDYLLFNVNGMPSDLEKVLSDYYWLTEFLDETSSTLQVNN